MFSQQRVRKKKGLTDLVDIIPFPEQNLREKAKPSKPKIKSDTPAPAKVNFRPEPKEVTAPTGIIKGSGISIKKILQKKEEGSTTVDLSNMPHDPYAFDDLKMAWRQFAFEMKNEGKETFFSALVKREPIFVEGDTYKLEVDNQVQVDYITPQLTSLLSYIRKKVNNYSVMVQLELTSNPEEDVKYLTGKDKFAKLARKNPNLHTLKNTFNLDIEY